MPMEELSKTSIEASMNKYITHYNIDPNIGGWSDNYCFFR
jgi:hypothetical protein